MSAKSMEDIASVMKKMHFRKKILGGVDEADVWHQLEKLQSEYRSAFEVQQERSRTLIQEREDVVSQVITARRRRLANRQEINFFFGRLVLMALLFWILFGVVFGIKPMPNEDMAPRISAGDLMLFYRLDKDLSNSDVVVFKKDGKWYTGRIVARGGDSVEVTEDSELKVNGSIVIENDIYYKTPRYGDYVSYPLTLAEDTYFILCDYREGAKDSRYFGPVREKEIKGKVITVIRSSGL